MTNARSTLALANVLLVLLDNRRLANLSSALRARHPRLRLLEAIRVANQPLVGLSEEYDLLGERLLLVLSESDSDLLSTSLQLMGLGERARADQLLVDARRLLLLLLDGPALSPQLDILLSEDLRALDRLLLLLAGLNGYGQGQSSWGLQRTPTISAAHLPR